MDDSTRPMRDAPEQQAAASPPRLLPPPDGELSPAAAHRSSGWKRRLAVLAVVGALGAAAALGPGRSLWSSPTTARGEMLPAVRTSLSVTFTARGSVESSRNRDVVNRVEGQSTILYLIPDGTSVKKGDLVCELDSSILRDKMTASRITINQGEADVQNYIKSREVAEFALQEYIGGTYPQERLAADIALKLAETNLHQAAERLDFSTRMHVLGYVAKSQKVADQDSMANSEITLDRSRTKIDVMEQFTRRKRTIELEASVQRTRSDEMAQKAKLALEKTKLKNYEAMINFCKLYAPIDGLVVHANEAGSRRGSQQEMLQEGVMVREGQTIVRIPDARAMRINAKLDESVLYHVRPSQPVRIRVDALAGMQLHGKVTDVNSMADPTGRDFVEIRLYTSLIAITDPPSALRPGMSARVEILANEIDDVLAVPLRSVIQIRGENYVYVATPDGPRRRGVRLGVSNNEQLEIVEGLVDGDRVAMNPLSLMTSHEQQQAFAVSAVPPDSWR